GLRDDDLPVITARHLRRALQQATARLHPADAGQRQSRDVRDDRGPGIADRGERRTIRRPTPPPGSGTHPLRARWPARNQRNTIWFLKSRQNHERIVKRLGFSSAVVYRPGLSTSLLGDPEVLE